MNYHSDLDILFLYEADGHTRTIRPAKSTQSAFFSELGQRIIRTAGWQS
jgi:glutamine synthetase adenylyltransferase